MALPQNQTNEEWLNDYAVVSGENVRKLPDRSSPPTNPIYREEDSVEVLCRYVGHRTTRNGCIALEFESIDGNTRATKFFNVGLKSSREKNYPAGKNGQFIPPELGNFRRFWMKATGVAPSRWCRVHKSMRSKLGELIFLCTIVADTDGKGRTYNKITEIEVNK